MRTCELEGVRLPPAHLSLLSLRRRILGTASMGVPNGSTSIAATRFPSHQLSNGLYVSGHPDQHKDRSSTISVPQMPYTGGDVKKSGELGKMFDIVVDNSSSAKLRKAGSAAGSLQGVGSVASSSHSGPLPSKDSLLPAGLPVGLFGSTMSWQNSRSGSHVSKSGPLVCNMSAAVRQSSKSGPLTSTDGDLPGAISSRKFSPGSGSLINASSLSRAGTAVGSVSKVPGQLAPVLPATGLITSGPLSSGLLTSAGVYQNGPSGPLDSNGKPAKHLNGLGGDNQAINDLSHDQEYSSRTGFPKIILWTVIPLFAMGFIAGAFIIAAVQNAILLITVAGLFAAVAALFLWNIFWRPSSVTGFLVGFPESELGSAKDGQFVKITGVVTCGSIPLQSTYLKVNRCVYTSTVLHEYRSLLSKPAREKHHRFTWGVRHLERHVVDFYISDLQSGLRALVKAGYGAQLRAYIEESSVLNFLPTCKEVPPDFMYWLSERNLCTSDRAMRLKEGYIKEGSTVTVFGIVQRNENVLMIVPPPEPMSTGCQWLKLLFPVNVQGLILTSNDVTKNEGIPL